MKHHAKDPARTADVPEEEVVSAEGVRGRDLRAELAHAPGVGEVVEEGEEDGEGLLHAEEAVEGPFAVELDDGGGARVRRVVGEAGVGYDVLAGVVAFGGAVPEEEGAVEGWELCVSLVQLEKEI